MSVFLAASACMYKLELGIGQTLNFSIVLQLALLFLQILIIVFEAGKLNSFLNIFVF